MTTLFRRNEQGLYAFQDPAADLDYAIPCWIEDATFVAVSWAITGAPSGVVHSPQINGDVVTVDEVAYAAATLASVFVTGLASGTTYTVTAHAVFSGGQTDERSFRLICKDL